MDETAPKKETADYDFIAPEPTPEPTPEQRAVQAGQQAAENADLLAALQRGDIATFSLWLQKSERELGEPPDPVAHGNLLVRAALLLHSAREDENAMTLLARAALLFKGRDEKSATNAVAFLRQVGGTKAEQVLKAQLRRAARERSSAIQRELIELQEFGSAAAKRYSPDALAQRIAALKAELQEFIHQEQIL